MTRCRIVGVGIALLALFTAQTCASAAKSPLGLVYDHESAVRIVPATLSEKPVKAPAMPPLKDDEIEVEEKVQVHIDGPLFGHRDVEEMITKRYKLAPRPAPMVISPPIQYHNYAPMFHQQPVFQQPMMNFAPPMQFAPPMMQQPMQSFGGGFQNCGPSG